MHMGHSFLSGKGGRGKGDVNMETVKRDFQRQITDLAQKDLAAMQRLLMWIRDGLSDEQIE